ncbi:MAG: DNA polymerase III subunit alpha [Ignavibacteriaceae bacterium]|nr:DNA polymerase III subunit alpha [Ignavibacteriaceae bacterium]
MSIISLHQHSNYSLLTGAVRLDDLISKAKSLGIYALALTDINGMYGLIQFYKKCLEEGIKPLLGVMIDEPDAPQIYALFIAQNREGYSTICRIITSRKLKDDFSLFTLLKEPLEGVFIITSSIELLKISGNKEYVFAELVVTGSKRKETRDVYDFAVKNNFRFVPVSPVYFLEKDDFLIHKVLTAIKLRKTLGSLNENDLVPDDYYFKTPSELLPLWKRIPGALQNLDYIVKSVNLDLELGRVKFPAFDVPDQTSPQSYLAKIAYGGLERRYTQITPKIIERLEYELKVINELGFTDYFLVVRDIVSEAKRRGMMVLGRGSAGNSLVSYSLGFTDVDPIKYDLYFERFLNRSRLSPPDIDIDFSWRERDMIVKYVFEKYGYEKVAMISTTVTFRARSAFRETAKVFGIPDSEISNYSKFIPWTDARNLPNLAAMFPESKTLKLNEEPWKSIVNIASKLAGYPRHLSIHPGGIVITPTHITNFTALEYAGNKGLGLIVTQPDMYPVEDLGLIKIDLLSQRSLGVLRDTMQAIAGK